MDQVPHSALMLRSSGRGGMGFPHGEARSGRKECQGKGDMYAASVCPLPVGVVEGL